MSEVTQLLANIEQGDPHAADQLLPLVYDELKRLAAAKLASEQPGRTLQATALVHEAYIRLVDGAHHAQWANRGHFFAAAAEAMRRILVESARRRQAIKHGANFARVEIDALHLPLADAPDPVEILSIHEALDELSAQSSRRGELVKLRYFLGCTMPETAQILGVAQSTAEEDWTYAKAWLRRYLRRQELREKACADEENQTV